MRHTLLFVTIVLFGQSSFGQDPLDKYIEFVYGKEGKELGTYKTNLVTDEEIKVSTKSPIIIKTPTPKETFNIFTFNTVFRSKHYIAVLTGGDHPFKPKLVTIDKNNIQQSELLLLRHFEENKADFEVTEEVKISSPTDITLTTITHTWSLDEKGERIKNSRKTIRSTVKYQIKDNGEIFKIDSD